MTAAKCIDVSVMLRCCDANQCLTEASSSEEADRACLHAAPASFPERGWLATVKDGYITVCYVSL